MVVQAGLSDSPASTGIPNSRDVDVMAQRDTGVMISNIDIASGEIAEFCQR